jgi:hypothetical protein
MVLGAGRLNTSIDFPDGVAHTKCRDRMRLTADRTTLTPHSNYAITAEQFHELLRTAFYEKVTYRACYGVAKKEHHVELHPTNHPCSGLSHEARRLTVFSGVARR